MRRSATLALLLPLASCVATPKPALRPAPPSPVTLAPAPAPRVPADWRDWPVTPGAWRYGKRPGGGSQATFGTTAVTISLVCDPVQRRVTIAAVGSFGAPPMTVRTSTAIRTLPTQATAHMDAWPPVTHDAALAATDPLLDAMAFSRGRFAIERTGEATLVLPSWAEVGRVIEDCRG